MTHVETKFHDFTIEITMPDGNTINVEVTVRAVICKDGVRMEIK